MLCAGLWIYGVYITLFTWYGHKILFNTVLTVAVSDLYGSTLYSQQRDAAVLKKVKEALIEFGIISGLETNVEKTTLMPIGCLNEPLDPEILGLGLRSLARSNV